MLLPKTLVNSLMLISKLRQVFVYFEIHKSEYYAQLVV